MSQPNSPTSGVIATRRARQMVVESIGQCHRQALWCGKHDCVWPHGQEMGCNDFVTGYEAARALLGSIRGQ
jgi:hypothetical protein